MNARVLLERVADAISDPEFIQFDRLAVIWYFSVAVLFVSSVALGLHGSAITRYSRMGALAEPVSALLGSGKAIRSDEWAFHTPAILNQVYRAEPFAVETSAVGPDSAALIANIPVRHFTTIFRFQFWGFFLLPPAYAFSAYWQSKALLLLTGVFSLLLLLTRSSRIAAFGALWYFSSPYVQWTYSWASLLPDMIGLFCFVMLASFYMSVGRKPLLLAGAAVICVTCAVNFALCAYVPHQVPLIWLGIFLCVWWVSVKRQSIFARDQALARVAALGGAVVVVAAVMYAFYRDVEPAIRAIANTTYPGRRSSPAGVYPRLMFLSHFFAFWERERRIPLPQLFNNICECSGFLWLAPAALFSLQGARHSDQRRAFVVLGAFAVLLLVWMILPVPDLVGRITFMNQVGVSRTLHVLGLVNVALVGLALGFSRPADSPARNLARTLLLGSLLFAGVGLVLWLANQRMENFLTPRQVGAAALYATLLILSVVRNWFWVLVAGLIVPQLAAFGLVNPVDRGFQVLESAPFFQFVRSHPELLQRRWIVYSDSHVYPGFFTAAGCDVVTGLKIEPDLRALGRFDPVGVNRDLINQSGYLIAKPELDNVPSRFEQVSLGVVRWRVSPLDPRLKEIGVRYVAFMYEAPVGVSAQLRPLAPGPVGGFWLYELPN